VREYGLSAGTARGMTSTPNEPTEEPTVVPSGDPSPGQADPETPGEAPDDPAGDPDKPHGDVLTDPMDSDKEPGQMPESTNTEVGA
jgi:hypothetical protein